MTKEEFKKRWESDDRGDGITWGEIATCAKEWHLFKYPSTHSTSLVLYRVLKAAKCEDAEKFNPISHNFSSIKK